MLRLCGDRVISYVHILKDAWISYKLRFQSSKVCLCHLS